MIIVLLLWTSKTCLMANLLEARRPVYIQTCFLYPHPYSSPYLSLFAHLFALIWATLHWYEPLSEASRHTPTAYETDLSSHAHDAGTHATIFVEIWGEPCGCIDWDTERREKQKDASYIWEKCAISPANSQLVSALYIHATIFVITSQVAALPPIGCELHCA